MFGRRRKTSDFGAEIEAHLQLEADRYREKGLSEDEAQTLARRTFGNRTRARERFYESRRWLGWDLLSQDIRFGMRMLAKNPGTSAAAILTLALGIGANTAIFSLLNAVLLRDLPVVHEPQKLVLFGHGQWAGSQDTLPDRSWQLFSYPFYKEFQRKNRAFTNVAAVSSILFGEHGRIGSGAELEKFDVELVSGTYFDTLGVNPILGRALTSADDQPADTHPIAVASYSWWQRRFARNPRVIGTAVTINSTVYSVIGVAPPKFFGTTVGQSPDLWIPLSMEKQISPGWNGLENKLFQSLFVIARRKAGVTMEQAQANTDLLFKQILREYVGPQPSRKELADIQHARIELTSAATGLSQLRIQLSAPLKILMTVVVLVLLIACANVANLLLARAAARRREVAVRMSIGAGRARLIRQLLVESGILGVIGAAFGALFAWGAIRLFLAMAFRASLPTPLHVTADGQVLSFALAITLATVLLFGTAPAFQATRLELAPALKEGRGVIGTRSRNRLSRGLIVGQVSLSLMLLAGAGLFLRSLIKLMSVDTGFDKQNVVVVGVDPAAAGYQVDRRWENTMERVEERVSAVPGVRSASFAFFVFNGGGWTDPVVVPGRPKSEKDPDVFHNIVGCQFLSVMKTPMVLGRGLNMRDNAAGQKVAVINDTMARIYFPGRSPIGRTFSMGDNAEWQNIEVVGVAKDAKYMGLKERQRPAAFYPHAQHGLFLYSLAVRYTGAERAVLPEIRKAVATVDPNLPVSDAETLAEMVDDSVQNQRMVAQLSLFFGILAVFLACIGIYGVVSYGITQRTNELGVRMALGAKRADVLWMVLGETVRLVVAGVAAGLVLGLASGRLIQSQLFGLKADDPLAMGAAVTAMLMVALVAGYLPARRAMRIDPVSALRYE